MSKRPCRDCTIWLFWSLGILVVSKKLRSLKSSHRKHSNIWVQQNIWEEKIWYLSPSENLGRKRLNLYPKNNRNFLEAADLPRDTDFLINLPLDWPALLGKSDCEIGPAHRPGLKFRPQAWNRVGTGPGYFASGFGSGLTVTEKPGPAGSPEEFLNSKIKNLLPISNFISG